MNIERMQLPKYNQMFRIGFGKWDDKWFFRIDLWTFGIRITK